jgi:hypothetical protein
MQGLLLLSVPRLTESVSRMRTQTLLDLLTCVGGIQSALPQQTVQLSDLVKVCAPMVASRATLAKDEFRRRKNSESVDCSKTGISEVNNVGSVRDDQTGVLPSEPVRLEPEWRHWEASLRAFSADLGLATAEDLSNVTEALSRLKS